jgi:hypothetical protein
MQSLTHKGNIMLPKLDKPTFEMTIPSQKKTVRFRPFLVKEEKILLTAQQSESEKDIIYGIKQVLTNCAQDPDFNVNKLTTFDLEYMFLKLRAKSVNNIVDVSYRDIEDDKVYDFKINLDEVEVTFPDVEISNKIPITDTIGIIMKYPSVTILDNIPENASATDVVDYLIRSCIETIYDADTVYPVAEEPEEEVTEFLDSIDVVAFNKIRYFLDNLPKLSHKLEYKNSLGNTRTIQLETLRDFFTWG